MPCCTHMPPLTAVCNAIVRIGVIYNPSAEHEQQSIMEQSSRRLLAHTRRLWWPRVMSSVDQRVACPRGTFCSVGPASATPCVQFDARIGVAVALVLSISDSRSMCKRGVASLSAHAASNGRAQWNTHVGVSHRVPAEHDMQQINEQSSCRLATPMRRL